MNLGGDGGVIPAAPEGDNGSPLIGRWIKSRFGQALAQVKRGIASYRFDQVAEAIYAFTWSDYCDWYLELAKIDLADVPAIAPSSTRRTLVEVLEALLRLMHPVMPFISEELWQKVAPRVGIEGATIMLQRYPEAGDYPIDEEAEAEIGWIRRVIGEIRSIRSDRNVPPGKLVPAVVASADERMSAWLQRNSRFLNRLARLASLEWLPAGAAEPESVVVIMEGLRLLLPLHGLVQRDAEILRMTKQIDELRAQMMKSRAKLENPDFAARAPAAVVEKERQRIHEVERTLAEIEKNKERMEHPMTGS